MKSDIRVFKFGGASVNGAAAIRNVADVLRDYGNRPLVVVLSAMGKTTNALERVVNAYLSGADDIKGYFEEVKSNHWQVASELLGAEHEVLSRLNDLFVEVEWIIEEELHDSSDYIYDQIVATGELLSTTIVSAYLEECGIGHRWMDARDIILTDDSYRQARVDWALTTKAATEKITPLLRDHGMVLTQGFIGSTTDNQTTTLGREGSDYTAAVIANCLDASELTVWKDVPGILTADPARFENVDRIDRLTYREAIEMTYYGAKVLHPKTIKPLQNKQIPLFVRSFMAPGSPGTWIGTDMDVALPPITIVEENQALVHIATRDFSFMAEHHLSRVFQLFAGLRLKINMMRNSAISFLVCCNDDAQKIASFQEAVAEEFTLVVDHRLKLITIRHATQDVIASLLQGHTVVLEERFANTVQFVVRENTTLKPKTA